MATELPFLNKTPATPGTNANARDKVASGEDSWFTGLAPSPRGFGFRISRASPKLYSEKLELLRGGASIEDDSDESDLAENLVRRGDVASSIVFTRRMAWPGGLLRPDDMPDVIPELVACFDVDKAETATVVAEVREPEAEVSSGIAAIVQMTHEDQYEWLCVF